MGILASLFLVAGRLPTDANTAIKMRTAQYLIPAMLPILSTAKNINYFAHGGGAVFGAILGLVLLRLWKHDEAQPPFANLMALAALVFFAVAVYAIYPMMKYRG
jgi:membrane associated rhomboid family serine protease